MSTSGSHACVANGLLSHPPRVRTVIWSGLCTAFLGMSLSEVGEGDRRGYRIASLADNQLASCYHSLPSPKMGPFVCLDSGDTFEMWPS